jgi:hypothetical protein
MRKIYLDGRMKFKWILRIKDVRMWTEFIWLSTGFNGGLLDQMDHSQLISKNYAPWILTS